MGALGWLLNLGFAGGGEVTPVTPVTAADITITNPSTEQTNYIVRIVFDDSDDVAAGVMSASASNGTDLTFTQAGVTLNHWVARWDKSGTYGRVYVKVPTIPADGTTIRVATGASTNTSNPNTLGAYAAVDFNALAAPTQENDSSPYNITGHSNCQLSTGRILRAYKTSNSGEVRVDKSEDNGATWSNVSTNAYGSNGELSLIRVNDSDEKLWLYYTTAGLDVRVRESTDYGATWGNNTVIASEAGGGSTIVADGNTVYAIIPFAGSPNEDLKCYRSTGDITSWALRGTIANATSARWEDPTATILEGDEDGYILVCGEDEPGAAGDASDNAIRCYISDDGGTTWNVALDPLNVPAGDHEPGALVWTDLDDDSRELRLYFSSTLGDTQTNRADYQTAQIGYVVLTVSGTTVTNGSWNAVKLRCGRDGDPEGGVGVEAIQLANGNVLISWFSFSTDTTVVHQLISDPDVPGVVGLESQCGLNLGYDCGNTDDAQTGSSNTLQLVRDGASQVQYAEFALGTAYANISVEADLWKDHIDSAAQMCVLESDAYLMRTAIQASKATANYKPGEICYSVQGGTLYNSLDTLTTCTNETWYNIRQDFVDGDTTLVADTWVDGTAKSADDNSAARTTGIDAVRLLVDNWQAANTVLFDALIARAITPAGDVTIDSWALPPLTGGADAVVGEVFLARGVSGEVHADNVTVGEVF